MFSCGGETPSVFSFSLASDVDVNVAALAPIAVMYPEAVAPFFTIKRTNRWLVVVVAVVF